MAEEEDGYRVNYLRWKVKPERLEKVLASLRELWPKLSDLQRYHLLLELRMDHALWQKTNGALTLQGLTDLQLIALTSAVGAAIEAGLQTQPSNS